VTRTGLGIGVLVVITAVALIAMRRGWSARARWSGSALPSLPEVPAGRGPVRFGPVEATYLSSTLAGRPLERLAVHGLGVRSPAAVEVDDAGVLVRRPGSADLYLPASAVRHVTAAAGIAGTAVGRARLVLIGWQAGETVVETGLLPRHDADRAGLIEAVRAVMADTGEDNR
jgi:hypothetical protein